MRLVLDAGALIALDRADRRAAALVALGRRAGAELVTVAPVAGQAWRDGARQARLARVLDMTQVLAVDLLEAQAAGLLLGRAGTADVVDALLALAVRPGDQVLTSDPDDLGRLVRERRVPADVVLV